MNIEINPKFQIGDSVYVTADFRVIKCTVKKIFVEKDEEKQKMYYHIQPWNSTKLLKVDDEKSMFDNLDDAKELAMQNFLALAKTMEDDIVNITEEKFVIPSASTEEKNDQ